MSVIVCPVLGQEKHQQNGESVEGESTDIEVARAKQHTGEAEGIRFVYPGVHKLFVGKVKLQSSTRSARGGL